ncbi:MAG TPA: chorismate mutase [Planctomycetota bacterium]|nr:chorismate mutase [Planctomycetota bacterium]
MQDTTPGHDELERLRAAMDVCNLRLAAVLQERARLALAIGAWKRRRGLGAADPDREAAMLAQVVQVAPAGGFAAPALEAIFGAVFAESRRLVEDAARG